MERLAALDLAPLATVALPSRPRVLELATDADARPKGRASGNSHSRGYAYQLRRASRVLRNRRNPLMRLRPEWLSFAAIPLILFMDS